MIKLSDLQIKEVIMIESGKRLGHISDLEINPDLGHIVAIIINLKENKGGLFGKTDELLIYWDKIVTIGDDVILVRDINEASYLNIE